MIALRFAEGHACKVEIRTDDLADWLGPAEITALREASVFD